MHVVRTEALRSWGLAITTQIRFSLVTALLSYCVSVPPEGCTTCLVLNLDFAVSMRVVSCLGSCLFNTSWEEETSMEKMSSSQLVGKSVRHFHDWWLMLEGLAHCRQCHPWAGESGVEKKATWASRESKSGSSTPPWPLLQLLPVGPCFTLNSCHDFPQWSCGLDCELKWTLPSPSLFGYGVYRSIKKQTRTCAEIHSILKEVRQT